MRTQALWTAILAIGLVLGAAKGQQMTLVNETEKTNLAKRIGAISAETADLILRPQTKVDRLATPFFSRGGIYLVTLARAAGPTAFTVGYADGGPAVMLQNNPEGFFEVAEKAGTTLNSEEMKAAYGVAFLEATREFRKRFQILQRASDIQIIPKASAEEEERYRALEEKYQYVIQQPKLSRNGAGELKVYALVGQDLHRVTLLFESNVRLKRTDEVLEKALPIAFAK